jgi:hypothetical protein
MFNEFLALLKLAPNLADTWRAGVERADGERAKLRMLYLECLHNLDVLSHFRLDESGDVPEAAFLIAAPLLKIDAHEAVLLQRSVTDEDHARISKELDRKAHMDTIRVELRCALEAEVDGVPTVVDASIEPDAVQQDQLEYLRERREVTLHEALAFVTTKVRVLRALAGLGDEGQAARRTLLARQRLRNIRRVELAVRRDLLRMSELLGLDTSHARVP